MTHVTYRLTAKNRDQLRNPTLGNRVWANFSFYYYTVITDPNKRSGLASSEEYRVAHGCVYTTAPVMIGS